MTIGGTDSSFSLRARLRTPVAQFSLSPGAARETKDTIQVGGIAGNGKRRDGVGRPFYRPALRTIDLILAIGRPDSRVISRSCASSASRAASSPSRPIKRALGTFRFDRRVPSS